MYSQGFIFVSLLCVLLVLTGLTAQQVPGEEMTALSSLYNSTSGDTWRWQDEQTAGAVWNFTLDGAGYFLNNPCSSSAATNQTWQGVTCSQIPQVCSSQTCHINKIDLVSYGLSGYLPVDICNLSFLEVLSLDDNKLTGPIPREVGNMTSLERFALNHNQLTGNIPSSVENLLRLQILYLHHNTLTGTIPSNVGELPSLERLYLYSNRLTGAIPSSVWQLPSLQILYLSSNWLSGTIPSEVGQLTALQILYLSENLLAGSIPSDVWQQPALERVSISRNQLTGTIPSSMGQLASLKLLYFYSNQLTGNVPREVGQLTALERLALYSNQLTGTIPGELGQLTKLKRLYLDSNQLMGAIPSEVGQLWSLEILSLSVNRFTGIIPSEVGQLWGLQALSLHQNQLSGAVPSRVWQLTALDHLTLYINYLTGTISSEVGQLIALEVLYLDTNQLSGTIPSELGKLVALEYVTLHLNQLTGTIPSEVGQLTALRLLYCDSNRLSGTIPNTFKHLQNTHELWLFDNFLGGTLPADMSSMRMLASLFLYNNLLTGHVEDAFNHTTQLELTTIDISDNLLSGSLPAEMFLLPQLKVISLSVNCFEEELPPSLCSAMQVEVLSLNGLRAAEGCADSVSVPLSGVNLFNTIGGNVPSCVWGLRNLSVLHLTGNGLSGELVHSLPLNSQIVDLSLSHNQLVGTIPLDILNIANIDLSYNQLGGEYDHRSKNKADSSISLEINRLSGQLPVSELERVSNGSLSILRGNIFACNSVFENDEYSRDYVCGSRNLNYSLFVFVSAFGIAVLLVVLIFWARLAGARRCQDQRMAALHSRGALLWIYVTYLNNLDTHGLNNKYSLALRKIAMLSGAFVEVMQYAVKLLGVILVGSVVLYLVKALDSSGAYATHSQTYAWFWTLAYMRGLVPAGMLLMLWAVAISACFYYIIVQNPMRRKVDVPGVGCGTSRKIGSDEATAEVEIQCFRNNSSLAVGAAFVLNVCVAIVVNTLYIYSTQQALGSFVHFSIQLSLSIFRLVYVAIAFPLLSRPILSAVENVRFRFVLLAINNLLLPCVVTALTSDACFQGLLIPADSVRTPYSYRTCQVYTTPTDGDTFCSDYSTFEVESVSLIPPFAYNNQCGSVVLTSYIPVFLLGYSIQLMLPFLVLASLSYMPYGSIPPSVRNSLHGVLWPEYWQQGSEEVLVHNKDIVSKDPSVLLKIRTIFCNDVFNNWLVMLTFGLCSPVLAVAIVSSVLLKMLLWVLLIGRFTRRLVGDHHNPATATAATTTTAAGGAGASSAVDVSPLQQSKSSKMTTISVAEGVNTGDVVHVALTALAEVHIPLLEVLAGSFWRLVCCSALFVALLSWDMATDEVRWSQSLWVLLVPLGYVLVLRCVAHYLCSNEYCQHHHSAGSKQGAAEKSGSASASASLHQHEHSDVSRSPLHSDKL